jgi:two-component system LytT family response regulator
MKTKITALLVDDEENSRIVLRNLLTDFCPEIEICGEADTINLAYSMIQKLKPQLLFLDIHMPNASGFSLLKKFDPIPFEIIFVTSYDKYAINAFKFSALDYLLKPAEIPDLQAAVKKVSDIIELKTSRHEQVINLVHSIGTEAEDRKIAVHAGEKVKLLSEKSIVYIEADGRYSDLYLASNEHYTSARCLKDFEDYLGERSSFVRISQSILVNTIYIKEYSKGDLCIISMKTGKTFEVPRRKKAEILGKLRKDF